MPGRAHGRFVALVLGAVIVSLAGHTPAAGARNGAATVVRPLFDLASPDTSPFPSDRFTVPDANQNTGRRVNMPLPADCALNASDCEDVTVLNQLDGFNLQPRISIRFSGAIDPASVAKDAVFVVPLGSGRQRRIGVNYLSWDPATRELSGRPDESLEQHARYALVVTTKVRDEDGQPIGVADGYGQYRGARGREADADYRRALVAAHDAIVRGERVEIAALSVFTTQSFSYLVERMREEVHREPAPSLDFTVGPNGMRAVFPAADLEALTNNADNRPGAPLTPQPQNLVAMRVVPGAVGTLAFGTFRAPDFTAHPSGHIPPIPTRTGRLIRTGWLDTAFNLWLPAGTPPAGGWPVAIYGTGSFGSKNTPFTHAAILNSHGVAVLAINPIGRGGGPRTTMTARLTSGREVTFAAPGLGEDQNHDGTIEDWEPRRALRPFAALNTSGSIAEATAQHFALVRAIQAGVDVDGNGTRDLDPARIYFVGQSLGAMWGMYLFVYEPAVRAAVFTVPVGTLIYNTALGPSQRSGLGEMLATRVPPLINATDGLRAIDGVTVAEPYFNENLPLRDQPVLVNRVAGAAAIQRVMDHIVWCAQPVNTVPVAPLLRRGLGTAPPRPFIVQWARSDQMAVNPTATAELTRAGDFADRVYFYRHDLNVDAGPVPPNPHAFLSAVGGPPAFARVARGAQHQVGAFFASDGRTVPYPEPRELWESPMKRPLPEDTHFLQRRQ